MSDAPRNYQRALAVGALLTLLALVCAAYWQAREQANTEQPTGDAAHYAGSARCRSCHAKEYAAWQRSHHARAERGLGRGLALRPPTGVASNAVIGAAPLVQFLVPTQRGHVQAHSLAVDATSGEHFDVFADGRTAGEWGHWTGRGNNWNSMCASCHNTGFAKHYDATTDSYASTRSEQGVGCEACHGPAAEHVERPSGLLRAAVPVPRPGLEQCAPCHARRTELTTTYQPSARFADHFALETISESNAFHADGQVREESFEVNAFLGSAMHTAGVSCGDCHDGHGGTLLAQGNALCQRCHAPEGLADAQVRAPDIDPREHTHHTAGAPGDACVDCHMPTSVFMQRDVRRDHGLQIPDPALTVTLGIPNACQRCHASRGSEWMVSATQRFWGRSAPRPRRAWAKAISAAQRGDRNGAIALIRLTTERTPAFLYASSLSALAPFAAEPGVLAHVRTALDANDALVRAAAVRALAERAGSDAVVNEALHARLTDSTREVRIAAAWALRASPALPGLAQDDLAAYLALHADQPAGQWRLAQYHAERGDTPRANTHFERTIAWDPSAAAPRRDFALFLAAQGDVDGARGQLEAAVMRAPDDAGLHFELGLIRFEAGDLANATTAFERAVALAPNYPRAWLNLGLAHAEAGALDRGLQALAKGEAVASADASTRADLAYAAATLHLRRGETAAARAAATRALAASPNHANARALLPRIAAPP